MHVLTDLYLYQSAALPPLLAAPAQTWKPKTVNMNGLANNAAAASAQIHLGSASLVSWTPPLELESGRGTPFALLKAAAARVSVDLLIQNLL